MLDSTIETIQSDLASRYPSSTRKGRDEIEADGLPRSISSFLVHHLERKAQDELSRLDLAGLRWIDVDDPNVRERFDIFREKALEEALVPEHEWDKCLKEATLFAVGATINPRATLTNFVFRDQDKTLSRDLLVSRLRRFEAHRHLGEAVVDSLQKRPDDTYTRERFRSLVDKVDDLRTDGFTASDWLEELSMIGDLLAEVGLPATFPAREIADFLSARRFSQEAGFVAEMASGEQISLNRAKDIIAEARSPEDQAEAKSEGNNVQPDEWTLFSDAVEKGAGARGADGDSGSVPLWKRFQKDFNAPMGSGHTTEAADPPTAPTPPTPAKSPSPDRVARAKPNVTESDEHGERSQRPLWQQYRSGKTDPKSEDTKEPDLQALELGVLGPDASRGRHSFIDDLFGGDEKAYLEAMEELSHANTWGEASKIIADRVFKRFKVNIYSEPAVAFTNAVEARYRRRRVNA